MKCLGVVFADLVHGPLGLPSRLDDELAGRSVLRRTIERLERAKALAGVHVLAPADQVGALRDRLAGTRAVVETSTLLVAPYRELARSSRAWGLDAWRGGVGGLTWLDEEISAAACAGVAGRHNADAIAVAASHGALVDPVLVDAMVELHARNSDEAPFTFCPSPPGLAPAIFARPLLETLGTTAQPPGAMLVYHPDQPMPDPTGRGGCYRPHAILMETRGRLIADTRRSIDRTRDLLAAGAVGWPAERICEWLARDSATRPAEMPEEIEIELTTEDPLAGRTTLRPRGPGVGPRGPIARDAIERIAAEIEPFDDVRIVLGGFGEPTQHPEFIAILAALRRSTALAIAVRTSGLIDRPPVESALFDGPADVLIVTLDAATTETYHRVHGCDRFREARARVDAWAERRARERRVRPLIVPEFLKTVENVADMEPFHDEWLRRLGTSVIAGTSDYAGQRPDRSVTNVSPPRRVPCRQIFRRMAILADGCVVTCDQDFAGRQVVGRIGDRPLGELWLNGAMQPLRDDHLRAARADEARATEALQLWSLCRACNSWHRP
jgi:hypothetical protein